MTKEQKVFFLLEQSIQCAVAEIQKEGYLLNIKIIKDKIDNYYYSFEEILKEKLEER